MTDLPRSKDRNVKEIVYVAFVGALFFLIAAQHLQSRFSLIMDEPFMVQPAVALLTGHPIHPDVQTIKLGHREWPCLNSWFGNGTLDAYVMLPIFKLFGIHVSVLRTTEITLTLIAGLLFCWIARFLFDRRTFYVAAVLIFFHATFLLWGRIGFVGSLLPQWLCLAATLLFWGEWLKTHKSLPLYLSCFFMGLGMYARLYSVGIVLGIALGQFLFYDWIFIKRHRRLFLKAFLFLLLGFSPFILWNCLNQGKSIAALFSLFLHPQDGGSNLEYYQSFLVRSGQILDMLGNNSRWPRSSPFFTCIKLTMYALIGLAVFKRVRLKLKGLNLDKSFLFLLSVFGGFMFCVSFAGTGLDREHVLVTLPLLSLCAAVILRTLLRGPLLIAALLLFLWPDFKTLQNSHRYGGFVSDNEQVYLQLSEYLRLQTDKNPISINDACSAIEILTNGTVAPVYAWSYEREKFKKAVYNWLKNEQRTYIFVFHQPKGPITKQIGMTNINVFFEAVTKLNMKAEIVNEISRGDYRIIVYRVV